jgi:cytochrome c biogenesis protein CcmG/thiol:disulfide interchange protein DsbE
MPSAKPALTRRATVLLPLATVGLGGVVAWCLLDRMQRGAYDPHELPSVLIGKEIPAFDLSTLPGTGQAASGRLTSREIVAAARPALVSFFASWCAPCVEEAPVLMELKALGVPIYGIAYKDEAAAAARFLQRNGDPFVRVGSDRLGEAAIDFGLYGVPETYVVDARGVVRRRFVGSLTTQLTRGSLLPLLKSLA